LHFDDIIRNEDRAMTTFDEQFAELNKHHDNVMSFIKESYKTGNDKFNSASAQAKQLFETGKFQEGTNLLSNALKDHQAHSKARWEQMGRFDEAARKIRETPITPSKSHLPLGMSKGKIAAIVAGVAVVGGGILLYRNHQQKKQESWATRIEQQRIAPQTNLSR